MAGFSPQWILLIVQIWWPREASGGQLKPESVPQNALTFGSNYRRSATARRNVFLPVCLFRPRLARVAGVPRLPVSLSHMKPRIRLLAPPPPPLVERCRLIHPGPEHTPTSRPSPSLHLPTLPHQIPRSMPMRDAAHGARLAALVVPRSSLSQPLSCRHEPTSSQDPGHACSRACTVLFFPFKSWTISQNFL
jgi:hypothetical protein